MAVRFWQLPTGIWIAIKAPLPIVHLLSERIVLDLALPTDEMGRIVELDWAEDAFRRYHAAYWQHQFIKDDLVRHEHEEGWLLLGSGFFLAYSPRSDSAQFFIIPERQDDVLTYSYPLLDLLVKLLQPAGYVPLHGAVLGTGNRFVLIPGKQNTGKSTTSATWVLNGGQLLTDDFCFVQVENPLVAHGFYPAIRLRKPALSLLDQHVSLKQLEQRGESKYFYSLLKHSPERFVNVAPLRAIFCLDIDKQVLSHVTAGPKTGYTYLASSVAFSAQYQSDTSLCLQAIKKLVRELPILQITLSPNADENFYYLNELIKGY